MVSKEQVWIEVLSQEWDGPMRLRVSGRSMWPTLRPGDRVTVEPAAAGDLRPGDWVVLRNADALIVHRFLGFNRHGRLITKGDGVYALDPPWPRDALVGRVVSYARNGDSIPVSSSSLRQRARTAYHRLLAGSLIVRKRFRRLLSTLLLLVSAACALAGLLAPVAWASVDLVSFEATPQETSILITWQTANETDMLAFYVRRSLDDGGEHQRVSGPIPAQGDIAGASYEWIDSDVVGGPTYYYYLEAVEISGSTAFHGPVSASLPLPPTDTPTPTPTPTPTYTPSATPTPSLTPSMTPTPTRTPTPSPTASLTLTPSPTTTPRPSPTGTLRPTRPRPTVTSTRTPTPTPTPSSTLPAGTPPPPESSPSPVPSASATPSPTPMVTLSPSPSPTEASLISEQPAEAASPGEEEVVSEEELARAERLRTVVLIGLGVLVLAGLGAIALALLAFAFYRWRSLRHG